jgi:hypothetical protein
LAQRNKIFLIHQDKIKYPYNIYLNYATWHKGIERVENTHKIKNIKLQHEHNKELMYDGLKQLSILDKQCNYLYK